MRRREFITLVGGAAATWPLVAYAQHPGGTRRIGMLLAAYTQTDREGQTRIAAFLDTLHRLGWIEGRNVQIDYRWAAGDADREKAFAKELVRSAPDVIVANGYPALAELHDQVRDRRAPVAGDVGHAGLQQRLGYGENALAAEFLPGAEPKLRDLAFERAFCHPRPACASSCTDPCTPARN